VPHNPSTGADVSKVSADGLNPPLRHPENSTTIRIIK
jgi:hypothetical protein